MERISLHAMPGLYKVMSGVEQYVNQCGLDLKLLELMRFRVSQINHCAYCLDMHFKEAVHHGETPLRLYSVSAWQEAACYTEKEKLVFEFAEKLTQLPENHIEDDLFNRMLEFFSKEEIMNLALAVAQINSWNRLVQVSRPKSGEYQVKA